MWRNTLICCHTYVAWQTFTYDIAMCLRVLRDALVSGGRALLQARGLWLEQWQTCRAALPRTRSDKCVMKVVKRQWGSRRDTTTTTSNMSIYQILSRRLHLIQVQFEFQSKSFVKLTEIA